MTLPLTSSTLQLQLEKRPSIASRTVPIQETSPFPDGRSNGREEDDMRPMASFMPDSDSGRPNFRDLTSAHAWRNRVIWKAGIIEGVAAASLNFISGLLVATLSSWPRAAIPVGIFFGNTFLVSALISATAPASGAHINPLVTIATAFSGLCHPVRAIVYIFCQLVGGALGGTFLRVTLGKTFAHKIHNSGCWIDPEGEVGVWQAALIEFVSVFVLLFLGYGVGLDPRQARLYGPKYGPVLVGLTVGLMTSLTATIHAGYTGAAMFPGRCFGLAVGIGQFQKSHWVWWIPDILAAALHGFLYMTIPLYMSAYPTPIGVDVAGA
ncbi:aquaporin-like protein [Thelephora ganbajun]|uniref:Aquaporin-like protein n=1 Tax=Thelephora ganbajun TaxID=370292 RepID=A0ACB6ZFK5_THEGA|nr:aquaporin-like protein [Thelephora ganbajun]